VILLNAEELITLGTELLFLTLYSSARGSISKLNISLLQVSMKGVMTAKQLLWMLLLPLT
jgi:hypothetical protein